MLNKENTMEVLVRFQQLAEDEEGEGLECLLVEQHYSNYIQEHHSLLVLKSDVRNTKEETKDRQNIWKKIWLRLRTRRRKKNTVSLILKEESASLSTHITSSDLSCSSIDTTEGAEPPPPCTPLIKSRIADMAIMDMNDIEFIPDRVSKEVIDCSCNVDPLEESDRNVTHVKTGIWQISCRDDDGSLRNPFFVTTAVSMNDRVDMKKLRKAVFSGQTFKRRPRIIMAPKDVAEKLTGYQSGTMAPICHSVNSMLFVEESIISQDGEPPNIQSLAPRVNVGSGIFGTCLSLPLKDFIQIANANPEGMKVCSLVQEHRQRKSSSQ